MKTYTTPFLKFHLEGETQELATKCDKIIITFESPEGDEIDKVWARRNELDNVQLIVLPSEYTWNDEQQDYCKNDGNKLVSWQEDYGIEFDAWINQEGTDHKAQFLIVRLSQTDTAILGPGMSKVEITFKIGDYYIKSEDGMTVSLTEAVKDSEVK